MPEEPPKPPATRTRAAKPRAGIQRKTREEREQFARQEAERQQARNAEASKTASTRGGGRGGRGGRVGAVGVGVGDSRPSNTPGSGGGVFGAGGGSLRSSMRSRTIPEGYSEMLDGGQSSKRGDAALLKTLEGEEEKASAEGGGSGSGGGGSSRLTAATRNAEGVEIATDDELDEPRRDINLICLSSDEDEDAIVGGRRKQKAVQRPSRSRNGLRPVRAAYTPRAEDEHTSAARRRPNIRGPSALKKSESDMIHEVEDEDENAMEVDEQPSALAKEHHNRLSSPEMRRRSLKKTSSAKSRDSARVATETIEERAERLRVMEDTHKLRDIFLGRQQSRHGHPVVVDEDEKQDDDDEGGEELDEEATLENGKLFLFQLPPLTPFLYNPATDPPAEHDVKQEPGVGGENISTLPPTTTTSSSSQRKPSDAATPGSKPAIKKEGDTNPAVAATGSASRHALQLDGLLTASEPTPLPAGLVGKLRVHASGKVSLDWGGTDMEVRYGTEVDFLQDAVLIQTKNKPKEKENSGAAGEDATTGEKAEEDDEDLDLRTSGKTYALGQVRRKMVLIPDWAKLYD